MGLKSIKKGAKKASKSVSDASQKAADDAAKAAVDAAKAADDAAAKAAAAAEKAAKDTVNGAIADMNAAIGTSMNWLKSSANGFSAAAQKLAADAQKELARVGDLARAILDSAFLAALERLVDQIFADLEDFLAETLDVLEAVAREANAAGQLAAQLAKIHSASDLTEGVKSALVAYMRLYPDLIAHAVLSDLSGFRSVSYGVFGAVAGAGQGLGADGGLAARSGELADAYTFQREARAVEMALYAGYARSIGTSDGVSGGVELASWRDPPSNLAGKFIGAAITVKSGVSGSVQFFFAADLSKFLGINVALSAATDAGVDFDVFTGETFTYLF